MLHEGFEKGAMESKFEWGGDFGAPDETYISSQFDKPVMVHHYPAAVKAFYMARDPSARARAWCRCARAGRIWRSDWRRRTRYVARVSAGADRSCTNFRRKRFSGISICGATAVCRTLDSVWVSNDARRGCAASSTFARRFRSRACYIGSVGLLGVQYDLSKVWMRYLTDRTHCSSSTQRAAINQRGAGIQIDEDSRGRGRGYDYEVLHQPSFSLCGTVDPGGIRRHGFDVG
jgi:hypothetical protein